MSFSFEPERPLPGDRASTRVAVNQAILRKVNEAMRGDGSADALAFRCECGRLGCNVLIPLTRAEYAAVRADSRRFAVVPGHEVAEIEDVVARYEAYAVVATHAADAVDVAERTSPR
jgi:hypothetical protein